jgi:hypothetical protein
MLFPVLARGSVKHYILWPTYPSEYLLTATAENCLFQLNCPSGYGHSSIPKAFEVIENCA